MNGDNVCYAALCLHMGGPATRQSLQMCFFASFVAESIEE